MKTKSTIAAAAFTLLLLSTSLKTWSQCADWDSIYFFSWGINKPYGIVRVALPWEEAAQCAQELDGFLVIIETQEEQDVIYNAIVNSGISTTYSPVPDGGGTSYIWIGATDAFEEGTWLWDNTISGMGENFWNGQGAAGTGNGAPVGNWFVNWGGKSAGTIMEPDNWSDQDAAGIALTGWPFGTTNLGIAGEWNDIGIENSLYFIVEFIPEAINEMANVEGKYVIFPNPAVDEIEIRGLEKGDRVIFTAADDRLMETMQMINQDGDNSFTIRNWSNGLYLVRIHNSTGTEMLRFIKH